MTAAQSVIEFKTPAVAGKLEKAKQALAEAKDVYDVKKVVTVAEAAKTFAKIMGDEAGAHDAAIVKLTGQRLGGQMLERLEKGKGGRPKKNSTQPAYSSGYRQAVDEAGLERDTAQRWQQVAEVKEPMFLDYLENAAEPTTSGVLAYKGNSEALFTSETPEWYTPADIIRRTNELLGGIDLDPCSNEGKPNVPAKRHFTRHDDGLQQEWHGSVYMNPPYGTVIEKWITKLVGEFKATRTTSAIALVPARVDTAWFREFRDFAVCFVSGRLKFSGHENSAPFPSAVVYLGPDIEGFSRCFDGIGDIWVRWRRD